MGLFKKKPIYKYKKLQRCKVNVDKTDGYCELLGSTDKYNVYVYSDQKADTQKYLLRQDRAKPKKVVYMGQAKSNRCVYKDKIYMIDRYSRVGYTYHPLFGVNIEDGSIVEYDVLSRKECYVVGGSFHIHSQDFVDSLSLEDGLMEMEVTRCREKSYYEKEQEYVIEFIESKGRLHWDYFFEVE